MDSSAVLNRLFGRLYRSLLQYVGENWPWSPVQKEAEEHAFLHGLLDSQMGDVKRLADYLIARRISLLTDNYPVKFTDLQYLSLAHLVREVQADQDELVRFLEEGAKSLHADHEAAELVRSIADNERKLVERSREFIAATPVASSV